MGNKSNKYAPAAQTDAHAMELDSGGKAGAAAPPDKSERTCCQKCALYSCFLGFAFILAGIICAFAIKPLIENKIRNNLPLVDGSRSFLGWKNPPVTPIQYMRIFNLTNEEKFLAGLEKPKLVEVGPYAYKQRMAKTNVAFADEDTVRFELQRYYKFAPELSEGNRESDLVIVPNIPLFGAMKKMHAEGTFAKSIFKQVLDSYEFATDTKPFLKMTVKEFLWGYSSTILSMARLSSPECKKSAKTRDGDDSGWDDFDDDDWGFKEDEDKNHRQKRDARPPTKSSKSKSAAKKEAAPVMDCSITPENLAKFGLFYGRNGTSLDPRQVNTGVSNLTMKGHLISWHDKKKLDYWSDAKCNSLEGSIEPGMLPLDVQKDQILTIFIGNLCRKINFKYVREVHHGSFLAYRFSPLDNTFDSASDTAENACYCPPSKVIQRELPPQQQDEYDYDASERETAPGCSLPSGMHDISSCKPGSPIVISWPHFLYGDPDLRRGVEGLHPDHEKHGFIIDVQPTYGITLSALARLQMNVFVEKNNGFGYFDKIQSSRVVLPFAWVEEGIVGPSEVMSSTIEMLLTGPDKMRGLMAIVLMGCGLLLLIPEIVFWIKSCFRQSKQVQDS